MEIFNIDKLINDEGKLVSTEKISGTVTLRDLYLKLYSVHLR